MMAEYEFKEFTSKIQLELEDIRKRIQEYGLTNVQISFHTDHEDTTYIWGKEPMNGSYISPCHTLTMKNGILLNYTISRYNEATGNWME